MKFDDLKKENTPSADPTTVKLPRLVHEELLQIVKRIGDRNHCKEGLGQLYDLRVSIILTKWYRLLMNF